MKNIVISLKNATDRREHIINEFGKQGIDFEFFDAITPDLLDETYQKLNLNLKENQRLSNGEKGCFLSHVYLWQKMIDEDIEYLAIFEDDVYLGENADLFLMNIDWLKDIDFDIIKLETWQELVHLSKHSITITQLNNQPIRSLHQLKSTHVGTAGYIICRNAIPKIIKYIKTLRNEEIYALDHVMFGGLLSQLTIYQLSPALVVQAECHNQQLTSQLEEQRKNNTFVYIPNEGFIKKIMKFFKRLTRSIGKRTFYKKVPFK